MAIRKIVELGDAALRKVCKPQEKFDQRLWTLLEDMADTMYKAEGVGLAAPQIGILRRVVLVPAFWTGVALAILGVLFAIYKLMLGRFKRKFKFRKIKKRYKDPVACADFFGSMVSSQRIGRRDGISCIPFASSGSDARSTLQRSRMRNCPHGTRLRQYQFSRIPRRLGDF